VRDSALAAVAAVILAHALLLVRGATDARFRSPREVGRALDLPVLSEFPPLSGKSRSREATSFLRTNLQLATGGRHPAVFLLTAPDATTSSFAISFSLAESFARNGERTLLIDSNLRQTMPKGGPGFDVGVQPSLRAHLEDAHAPLRPASLDLGAGVELDFITSFDPTPYASELLSRSMGHLLERALERYDVVVLDAAPVLAVADPLILAPHATGMVLVANVATLTRASADEALARLAPVRERLAGVVATEVRGPSTAAAAATRTGGRDSRALPVRPAAARTRQKAKPGLHHR
jgi:Mrp family chromosome partitioning ATPase